VVEDGGLLGYGPRFAQTFRQRARLVSRILRGVEPTDPPGAGGDQVRAGDQPQDRRGTRP